MSETITHLLVVDDDTRLRALLEKFLHEHGYYVSVASNVDEARECMEMFAFDLMVLDIMMPGTTGIEFAKELRTKGEDIPILMLTAMGDTDDRISGLESGADDYLSKPFEPRELVLRIESILKRANSLSNGLDIDDNQFLFGDFLFNTRTEILLQNDTTIALTETERTILGLLVSTPGETVSRSDIADALSGSHDNPINERSVDVQVNRLRQKIEADPKNPLFLQTVRGAGYRFVV